MRRIGRFIKEGLVRLLQGIAIVLVLILVAVVLVPLLPFILFGSWAHERWVRWRFQRTWGDEGKFMIFVYSESPNWEAYVEKNLLPLVEPFAVVLNWSRRSEWTRRPPIEVRAFWRFAGPREFNPVAIFIPRRGKIRVVRFWQAFRDYKHGKAHTLRAAEAELKAHLEELTQAA